jgi:hypothetical protein
VVGPWHRARWLAEEATDEAAKRHLIPSQPKVAANAAVQLRRLLRQRAGGDVVMTDRQPERRRPVDVILLHHCHHDALPG